MGEIIKREVIAYKGMNSDMTCKGFQYELGKSYKTDKVKLCEYGFHACLNTIDVLDYYPRYASSRYFKVKLSGEITKCSSYDTNAAATEITILEEITDNFNEVIETTEWWKNDNVLDLLYFSDGFARVKRSTDKLWNFIGEDGKFLYNEWFNWADYFNKDGFVRVQRTNGKWNFIDKDGKILSDEWFDWVDYFNKEGFAKVQRKDGKWNFIDANGKIISNEWYRYVDYFQDGLAVVRRSDYLWNFIDANGKILSNEWFYSVEDF